MALSLVSTNPSAELGLVTPWNWTGSVQVVAGGIAGLKCFKISANSKLFQTITTAAVLANISTLQVNADICPPQDYEFSTTKIQLVLEVDYNTGLKDFLIVPLIEATKYTGLVEGVEKTYYRIAEELTTTDSNAITKITITCVNNSYGTCYVDNFELWSVSASESKDGEEGETMIYPALLSGTDVKPLGNLVTDYIKSACIIPQGITLASPAGNFNSYEGGYAALALLASNQPGELELAGQICEKFASIQNSDGSWYQQYNPYMNGDNTHERVPYIDEGVIDGDLKVDSGAALVAWAMAEYDRITRGQRYKTYVQKAMGFLLFLQINHNSKYQSNMFANLVYKGQVDNVAFAADTGECILSIKHVLDAYGDDLTTIPYNHSVKQMGDDAYISLCTQNYAGDNIRYHATTYPIGKDTLIPFGGIEKLSYAQSISAWANVTWVRSGYASADYSGVARKCLEFINPLTAGQWGGQLFKPYYGLANETQNEYATNTALMIIALIHVDPERYAHMIKTHLHMMRWMALEDGRVFDLVEPTGRLRIALGTSTRNAYGFLMLASAHGVMAWKLAQEKGLV